MSRINCRRCSECPEGPHHWIDDFESLTGISCKHCPAIGVECAHCGGTAEFGDGDGDDQVPTVCSVCAGEGIIEVVRVDVVPGLRQACERALEVFGREIVPRVLTEDQAERLDVIMELTHVLEMVTRRPIP